MQLELLFNPAAGRGRATRKILTAARYLQSRGESVEVIEALSPGHLSEVAAERSRRSDGRLVICGGDGTLHFAIRRMRLGAKAIGILPLGSGDDFSKAIGIPMNLREACDVLAGSNERTVDVALANGTRYLGVAGMGFDSEVARFANESTSPFRGSLLYLYSILRVLPRFTPHRIRWRCDGKEHEERVMFVVVGNSPRYGGGVRIVPSAVLDDGCLDMCAVHECTRVDLLRTLPLAYTGAHVKTRFVSTRRGKEFHFECDEALDVFADGEFVTRTPVSIGLEAEQLRVIVP